MFERIKDSLLSTLEVNAPLASGVLIVVGVLLSVYGIGSIARTLTTYETPFDQIDSKGQGFLPAVNLSGAGESAPALPTQSHQVRVTPTVPPPGEGEDEPEDGNESASAPTPQPAWIPERIVIPEIGLSAPVIPSGIREIEYLDEMYEQWQAPNEFAAGWHDTSASLGVTGNTVLNGHHNVYGAVFENLVDLEVGDMIWVYSGDRVFLYQTATRLILKERWQSVEVRLENARWLQRSQDERLTLVTCWPHDSNTHRLIIAARPIRSYQVDELDLEGMISPDAAP